MFRIFKVMLASFAVAALGVADSTRTWRAPTGATTGWTGTRRGR